MGAALLSYATDNTLRSATLSMTNVVAAYPATNGNDLDPQTPLKASTTSTVITMTHGGSVTAEAFAIINHNLVGATCTLANSAGYSQAITIPARTGDGQCVNAWRDMRSDANRSATVWTLTITGASANVQIGELVMSTTLRAVPFITTVGSGPSVRHHWPKRLLRTFYHARMSYDTGARNRFMEGVCATEAAKVTFLALVQSTKGASLPFLFIPDRTVNDAWLAMIPDASEFIYDRQHDGVITGSRLEIEEMPMGLVL